MADEKACGAIIFTNVGNVRKYVILCGVGAYRGNYGFPKGHVEAGETERETAIREVKEETGLDVVLFDDFRTVDEHALAREGRPNDRKTNVYFLAEYHDQEFVAQKSEVSEIVLLDYGEAMNCLQYEESRRELTEAEQYLNKRMNTERFSRTELLLGKSAMQQLSECRVAVFGIGGVGGYVCEALARSGIGAFDLVDDDKVCMSNINRQIIATQKTVGKYKTDVMKERILDINPEATVNIYNCFFLPENASDFPFEQYDYVIDAIDTVTAKIELVMQCQKTGTPIISAMGAGNKLDATRFRVADIYKTSMDPLAKVMRHELKKRGVKKLKVVYSEEIPITPSGDSSNSCGDNSSSLPETDNHSQSRRSIPGSTAFVPSVAGLIIAGEVIKDLTGVHGRKNG